VSFIVDSSVAYGIQLISCCREHVLRKVNDAWKVARRTIVPMPFSMERLAQRSRAPLVPPQERENLRVRPVGCSVIFDGTAPAATLPSDAGFPI
jgi:hypothetical protein